MNYEEAIEYIHGIYWRGSKLGLSRTEELLGLLGNPQKELKFERKRLHMRHAGLRLYALRVSYGAVHLSVSSQIQ